MHLSIPKQFPLFILTSSVCWSLQCLISALTQGERWWSLFLGSLVQSCCGEGGTLQTNTAGKQISLACMGRARSVSATMGLPPLTGVRAFLVYTAQAPGCSTVELSKEGPGLRALPRSKLLVFRFSGTPPRHRLGWACGLCPSQVRAAQATRCLVSALSQVCGASHHLPSFSQSVSWVHSESTISGVPCVSSAELISGCDPPGGCQQSRIPGRLC